MRITNSEGALPQCTCMCLKYDLHCPFFFKHYWQQQYCGHVSEDCFGQGYMHRLQASSSCTCRPGSTGCQPVTACNCPSSNSTY